MTLKRSRSILVLSAFCVGCSSASPQSEPQDAFGPLVSELAHTGPFPRLWAAQISVPVANGACAPADTAAYSTLECAAGADGTGREALITVASRIGKALRSNPTADAAHAAALLDLLSADTARKTIDRSISYLEMATRLSTPTAPLLADLAAAHLARTARFHDARDLVAALEATSRALDVDSTNTHALYNHILALDELSLSSQAQKARAQYLRFDSTSQFARDLQQRRRTDAVASDAKDFATERVDSLSARVRRAPVAAFNFAWEHALGAWGDAYIAGDAHTATTQLGYARTIGTALASLGDSLTLDAVRAIDTSSSAAGVLRIIASAHAALATAQRLRKQSRYAEADSLFAALLASRLASPALSLRIASDAANHELSRGRLDRARTTVRTLRVNRIQRRYPAIAGRALWTDGLINFRQGQTDSAWSTLLASRALFERISFDEYAAWVLGIEGELLTQTGSDAAGHSALVEALRRSVATPRSVGRHNTLFVLANVASVAGLPRAAIVFEGEDRDVNGESGSPITRAETEISRVRLVLNQGKRENISAAIRRAAQLIAEIPDTLTRTRLYHELGTLRGRALIASDPSAAKRVLDSTVAVLAPIGNSIKTLPALIARANAAVAAGDDQAADADLRRVAALYLDKVKYIGNSAEGQRERLGLLAQRQALLRQSRPVFDSLILRRLRRGDADAAVESLEIAERWRHALSSEYAGRMARDLSSTANSLTLAYALIGRELVIWDNATGVVQVQRVPVPRDSLETLVERARIALEHADTESAQVMLGRLYTVLIAPVESKLRFRDAHLRVVLDDALTNVPMAALWDEKRKQFLVERAAIRVSRFWTDSPLLSMRDRAAEIGRALIVEEPAFDRAAFPSLAPLPRAREESDAVSQRLGAPMTLRGEAANVSAVRRALATADLFHFAGHAVLNDARPERSALVMGASGLTAADIAQLDLRRLRVAVLSACETSRSAESRGAGFGELTTAFLLAGTGGVIGSLWRAEDAPTAQLMAAFYQHFSASLDAGEALRKAQLSMITQPVSDWAAFRYMRR